MSPRSNAVLQFPHKTTSILVNRKVPTSLKNADYRSREYLTEDEVQKLMDAAGRVWRHGHRDATLIMLAYRHGLRVTELVSLRWDQIDLKQGLLHINRLKQGNASMHPLRGLELRALRRLQREYPILPYVFISERRAPLTDDAVRKIVRRPRLRVIPWYENAWSLTKRLGWLLLGIVGTVLSAMATLLTHLAEGNSVTSWDGSGVLEDEDSGDWSPTDSDTFEIVDDDLSRGLWDVSSMYYSICHLDYDSSLND